MASKHAGCLSIILYEELHASARLENNRKRVSLKTLPKGETELFQLTLQVLKARVVLPNTTDRGGVLFEAKLPVAQTGI